MDQGDATPRILLCERSQTQARLVRAMLSNVGYAVEIVSGADEAKAAMADDPPDILITGLEIGEISGIELCWALKSAEHTEHVYTIVLTATDDRSRFIEALDAGADDYLTKPANEVELHARLRAASRIIRMQRTLRDMADTDPLTGAYNRRFFMRRLNEEVSRGSRYGSPYAVMMIDIDHFKSINDTHGHAAGDAALIQTVTCLCNVVRDQDVVGRLGGEEFAVLCRETDVDGALALAARLRREIADIMVKHDQSAIRFTASFGVAGHGSDADTAETLLATADEALYWAKETGRNRVVLGGPSEKKQLDGAALD